MPTSSFDKVFEIKSQEEIERFINVMKKPHKISRKSGFSIEERNRSEALLKECLSRSRFSKVIGDVIINDDDELIKTDSIIMIRRKLYFRKSLI